MASLSQIVEVTISRLWYEHSVLSRLITSLLMPLSWLYYALAQQKKQRDIDRRVASPLKVIVIGNITAGGTGKTPLLIALAGQLAAAGWRPGIISRGHGGHYLKGRASATFVNADSDPSWVGDEPVLIAQALNDMPIIVCPRRVEALNLINSQTQCNVILSDDGLQHYTLPRTIEIALVDSARGFGNQKILPAGPLREPLARLSGVDIVVFNGQPSPELQAMVDTIQQSSYTTKMAISAIRSLGHDQPSSPDVAATINRYNVIHLLAGIGNPERFFNAMRQLLSVSSSPVKIVEHIFPDHHQYTESDIFFDANSDSAAIVMTAKDAVKCRAFAETNPLPIFAIDVTADMDSEILARICEQLTD